MTALLRYRRAQRAELRHAFWRGAARAALALLALELVLR